MKEIAAAFATLDQEQICAIERAENGYVLNLPSGDVTLNKGDFEISSEDMPGWTVATEGSLTIALDIEVSEQLRNEGVARELVNRIQNLRKDSGFEVTDKVDVRIYADGEALEEITAALASYKDYVATQTLALSIETRPAAEAGEKAAEVEWNEGKILVEATRR